MIDFRRVFNTTREEKISSLEHLLELHYERIGYCGTCRWYIGSDMPGFVIDYGSCKKKCDCFSKKVCGLKDITCSNYEENLENVNYIKEEIKKMKGEQNDN